MSRSAASGLRIQSAQGSSIELPAGACIHLMGVGGVGMASLAGLLVQQGFKVTGSDGPIYPPASVQLKNLGLRPMLEYRAENLQHQPDLVVVGNVISRSNPEAQFLMQKAWPYISFPQALMQFAVRQSRSVVVAGTHGKTTTASMLAAMAQVEGPRCAGHMIGGQPVGLPAFSYCEGAPYFILEGDEYDTAFFNKVPKFMHYRPHAVLLTGVEFDHADIYSDLKQVQQVFEQLVRLIPEDGVLVACTDSAGVRDVLPLAKCPVVTYGFQHEADFEIRDCVYQDEKQTVFLGVPTEERFEQWQQPSVQALGKILELQDVCGELGLVTQLPGPHNALNATGAWVLGAALGWSFDSRMQALDEFRGVQRRCQKVGKLNGAVVVEDFAHHPTAVRFSVHAMRELYQGRRVWAVFEPRSNTSRRRVFHKQYVSALGEADRVLLAPAYDQSRIAEGDRLDVLHVVQDLKSHQVEACTASVDELVQILKREASDKDVILIMSNGAFGGLIQKLELDGV